MIYLYCKGVITLLEKNIEKQKRKNRSTWQSYYERVTKNKKAYNRKKKHKNIESE